MSVVSVTGVTKTVRVPTTYAEFGFLVGTCLVEGSN